MVRSGSERARPRLDEYRELRRAGDLGTARDCLRRSLRSEDLEPIEWTRAGAWLRKTAPASDVPVPRRVLFLAQCTATSVLNCLVAVAWARGVHLVVQEGQFDNVVQDILTFAEVPDGFDAVAILPWWRELPVTTSGTVGLLEQWVDTWRLARERMRAPIIHVGYDLPVLPAEGTHLAGAPGGLTTVVRALNTNLRAQLPAGSFFLDLELLRGEIGRRDFYDLRQFFWTRQPFSERGAVGLATWIHGGIAAMTRGPKKVLVVDLDNTLWGGVVGEVGAQGVGLGDDPVGESFRAFQRQLKALSVQGVLLAVASKNNPEDAREPFRVNGRMVLSMSDFASFEASWDSKVSMLSRIAADLNLGLDSFVFFDDAAVEREEVRQRLPEVEVVDVPRDPSEYTRALANGHWFEAVSITEDDRQRVAAYRLDSERRSFKGGFTTRGEYLSSLEMQATIFRLSADDEARAAQLIAKTNQFNLTNRRHSRDRLRDLVSLDGSLALGVRLRDRFGDYGLISVLLAIPEAGSDSLTLRIDTWVMSCRAIGRTVEHRVFASLMRQARDLGYLRIVGDYGASTKNGLVRDLFATLGLSTIPSPDPGFSRFEASLAELVAPTSFVTATE